MSELKKVGNYKLVKKIGTGSTSEVFEGRKEGELERYAIKMIKNRTMSKQQKEMIAKEVLIIKNITHPHIVRLHDTLETPNHYYLIFEFCERGDLEKYLKDNVGTLLELTKVRTIIRCISQAVAHLHSKGIAHRDIKLANILLKRDFTIKLADFGFARQSSNEEAMMKTYCGTPITMAPEIMEGKPYDKKCDVWSLGVILFQLTFGKLPFPIDQGQVVFIKKVTTERVELPTTFKVPKSLADLIFSALEQNPAKRCSVEQFLSSSWMAEQNLVENVPTKHTESINQILKQANKELVNAGHCREDQGKDSQCLERLLAGRVYEIMYDEMTSIFKRHLTLRAELLKLVEGTEQLKALLYYYDCSLLNNLKAKKIKLRFEGVEDVLFPLEQLTTLQMPLPLVPNPGQVQQAGVVLSNYLRVLAKSGQRQGQNKLSRYLIVTKFIDLIQNFEIEVIFLFNNGYEYELSLDNLAKWMTIQPEERDPSLFHKGLNHITIALQCREKEQKFRECANTLKANCQKRMDAIQREINSY